ncbi:MAG: helix-turn-helix domain-containing protein [Pseudomonadota bacterium]
MENTQAVENATLVNRAVEASSLNGAALDVAGNASIMDSELVTKLDSYSLESIVELKISRFLDQIGTYYPESLHALIMRKSEKPLLAQILRRTGGNQVHAARILGINRNTLRKKMKVYGI